MKRVGVAALAIVVLAGLGFVFMVACSGGQSTTSTSTSSSSSDASGYTTISPAEAKGKIDAGGVTIVDVRTQAEYDEGHIDGAVLVPLDTINGADILALPDKSAMLIVYCRTGVRSAKASAVLAEMGYTHVLNMDGGITAWTYGTVK